MSEYSASIHYSKNIVTTRFLCLLEQDPIKPLVAARVIRWVIKPTGQSKEALLDQKTPWDILLIYEGRQTSYPSSIRNMIRAEWSLQSGIPASVIASFKDNSPSPGSADVPRLPGSLSRPPSGSASAQSLELDEELHQWITSGNDKPKGAVSMLNLLAFHPGKQPQYLKYGKAFADDVGRRRGGLAKLVGKSIPGSGDGGSDGWDEVSLTARSRTACPADADGS
ncbi:MAG: hypothetical protein Q9219_003494 [cf. Caloplaca sp. 3 TL-2023]